MKHPELPYICLIWDDAVGGMTGKVHELQHRPERCQTYGWLLRSDEIGVSIASDWVSTNEEFRDVTFVPRPMVVEELRLHLSKTPKKKVTNGTTRPGTPPLVGIADPTDPSASSSP